MKNENYIIHLTPQGNVKIVKNPDVFKGIIGQEEVCKKLTFFVNSHSLETPLPTMLFTGSQGLGKTYMASKMALATGRELVEVNCGTIISAKDFIEKILLGKVMGNTAKTLLLDEAHKLSPEITTLLLTLLNPNKSNINLLPYGSDLIEYDFSKVNTILATTDAYRIFKPLLNRCEEVYFHLYSNDELCRILESYLPNIRITCDREDLAYACRGRARDAYLLSQHIKRYCIMEHTSVFNDVYWKKVRDIFGINDYGLTLQEVRLIKEISENGPISSTNLATKMGVSVQNIESELEIRLRELSLIDSTSRGRILTDKGVGYLITI